MGGHGLEARATWGIHGLEARATAVVAQAAEEEVVVEGGEAEGVEGGGVRSVRSGGGGGGRGFHGRVNVVFICDWKKFCAGGRDAVVVVAVGGWRLRLEIKIKMMGRPYRA